MNEAASLSGTARTCGACTLCCKLFDIRALAKPQFEWCKHCAVGQGCRVYERRPDECREFNCTWLLDSSLGEEWKPSRSKIVLTRTGDVIGAHTDPARPDAWRKHPYHAQIRAWAAQSGARVIVWEGPDAIVLLPGGDKRLGRVPAGHHIVFCSRRDAMGRLVPDAVIMAPDDPAWSDDDLAGAPRGDKDHADLFFSRGLAAAAKGAHEQAIAHFGQAIAKDPKLFAAHDARAVSLLQLGRPDGALADADRAAALAPDQPGVHNNRAMILCAAGRMAEGMAAFDAALRLDPKYARAYFNRGAARHRTGDRAGAVADFGQALGLDPGYLAAYIERGVTRFQSGAFAEAAADFTEAARLDPEGGWDRWSHVARARSGAGAPPTVAPGGDRDDAFFAGQAHLLRGEHAAAIDCFQRVVAGGSDWSPASDCARAELARLVATPGPNM